MENLALYREYRPKTFDEVIGQEHITKTLKNQIKTNSISHAYLFCGTRGTGKTSTAKIFAKAINCINNVDGSPCYICEVCKNLKDNSSLDILEIDAASNNRVDEIRDLREKIKYPPVNGKYKVYIIDEVHMLTDSAYNALLKTLEEPPKHAVFILCTTEVHKLPQTILSRCMRFDFRLVSILDLTKQLTKIFNEKNIKYEEEALHLIASRGEGSVRDTLSIADLCASFSQNNITYKSVLEALGSSSTESLSEIAESVIENDGEKLLLAIDNLATSGKNFNILGKELVNHFKTLLTIKTVKNAKEFLKMPDDMFANLSTQADKIDKETLLNAMNKLTSIETQLKFSINPRTLLEITLLGLIDIEKKTEFVEKKTKNVNSTISNNLENNSSFTNKNTTKTNNTSTIMEKISTISDEFTTTSDENSTKLINFPTKSEILQNSFEDENIDDVFKNNIQNENLSAQKSIAKILKNLRENNFHLLTSIFQNLKDAKIVGKTLQISFDGENYKEILEKLDNKSKINDIIKEDNLIIDYSFEEIVKTKSIKERLKEKFNDIEIKE